MRKAPVILLAAFFLSACNELQQVINQLPDGGVTPDEMASGLREALDQGIDRQVVKLAAENGFYGNDKVRILLPEQLRKVDRTLRDIGLSSLADEGLLLLNRAAEDAVGRATPIFVDAVKGITFADARDILMGEANAATAYLEGRTAEPLYGAFLPVIQESFSRVGADRVWTQLINRYNSIPLVERVNPDLSDYVAHEALDGVYSMIAEEEARIRSSVSARTTDLLRRVFALQDNYRGSR